MSAQIFQLVGIAFVTAVAAILVKGTKPELAVVITIAGSVILLLFILEVFRGSLSIFLRLPKGRIGCRDRQDTS